MTQTSISSLILAHLIFYANPLLIPGIVCTNENPHPNQNELNFKNLGYQIVKWVNHRY